MHNSLSPLPTCNHFFKTTGLSSQPLLWRTLAHLRPGCLFKHGVSGSGQKITKFNASGLPRHFGLWRVFHVQPSTSSRLPVFEKGRYERKPCIQNLLYLYCSRCDAEHCIVIRRCAGFAKQGVLVGHFTHVLAAVYTRSGDINQLKGSDSIIPTTQIFPTLLSLSQCAGEIIEHTFTSYSLYNAVFATVYFYGCRNTSRRLC